MEGFAASRYHSLLWRRRAPGERPRDLKKTRFAFCCQSCLLLPLSEQARRATQATRAPGSFSCSAPCLASGGQQALRPRTPCPPPPARGTPAPRQRQLLKAAPASSAMAGLLQLLPLPSMGLLSAAPHSPAGLPSKARWRLAAIAASAQASKALQQHAQQRPTPHLCSHLDR